MLQQNPYLGPRAFTREHRLYGRDREVRDLTSLLVAERIVLLYSPSGAGKSSLIQAALIPALEARQFRVLPIVRVGLALPDDIPPGVNRYLAAAALSIGGDEAIDRSLADLIVPSDQSEMDDTVIIFDQFEELLTVDPLDRAAKVAFCQTIGDLLRKHRNVWALFAIREDYLAPLMEYAYLLPSRFRTTFRLDLLGPEAALAAIRQPALALGVEFDQVAAQTLVDDLRRSRVQLVSDQIGTMLGSTVEPVQLQVVCYRLWQRLFPDGAPTGAVINAAALRTVGSVDAALADYYAERVAAAAATSGVRERVIRDWFDQQLITATGIRNQVLRGEGTTAGLPNQALLPLIDAYLIRAEQRRNFIWYELAHDRLIEPVRQNNAAWREQLSPFQRQAALWAATDRPESLLLHDDDLVAARNWVAAHPELVEQIDEEFLAACLARQAEIDTERRRERLIKQLGVVSAILAVVMFIAAAAAFFAYQEAERLSRLARIRELTAEAAVNLSVDPQLSLLLARQAVLIQREREEPVDLGAMAMLYRALATSRVRATFDLGAPVTALAVSQNERWWAAAVSPADDLAEVVLVERSTGQMQRLATFAINVSAIAFSPDGAKLAAVTWDGTILIWNTLSPDQPERLWHPLATQSIPPDDPLAVRFLAVAFSPDGQTLYTTGYDGWLRRWDLATRRQIVMGGIEGVPLRSLTIDPAGVRIAAASQEGQVLIWRMRDGELVGRAVLSGQPIAALAYTPAGTLALIEETRLIETNGEDSTVLTTFGTPLNDLNLSPDGFLALVAANDGNEYVISLSNGKIITVLRGHTDQISQTRWLPGGQEVVTASFDGTVRFWDVSDLQWFAPTALAADPQRGWVAVGGENGRIALFTRPNTPARPLLHHTAAIEMLAFSPDGRWLAAAGADAQVSVWDVASGRLQAVIEHRARVRNVAFSADGSLLLTSSRTQALLWQWQQSVTRPLTMLDLSDRFETIITGAALHPTQPLLAIVTRDGLVMVWNYRTAQTLVKTVDERANGQVRFNPQGTVVVSESNEGIILVRDSATLNQRDFPASHRGGIADFAFDPSGTLIATAGFDQTVKIWQFADGIEQMRMGVDGLPVAIGFSGPRELVAVSANGSVIRLPLNLDTALDLAVMRSRRPTADECVRYQLAREDASLCQ
jgi:WD40 repeat protein